MHKEDSDRLQLDKLLSLLTEFSQGNFNAKAEVLCSDSELNALTNGLNSLGSELGHLRKQTKTQNILLQNIVGSIDEVVYAWHIAQDQIAVGNFEFISEQCLEIIGYSHMEVQNNPDLWLKTIHPDDRLVYDEGYKKLTTEKSTELLYRLYHPQKKGYRWIEDRIVARADEHGRIAHLYGSARDVTKQQEDKIELETKNEFISRMVTSSDQFFYIVALNPDDTFENHFTYLSWQIEKIQGSTVESMKKSRTGWIDLVHPDDLKKLFYDNRRMFSSGKPTTRIYRVKHAITQEYIWLEDYVVPVKDASGNIIELYGSARDINARRVSELERDQLNEELNHRYNELMQFNYIVSHNLRSPIANIMALSTMLNNGVPDDEAKQMSQFLLESAERMDTQLRDLNTILSAKSAINSKKETVKIKEIIDAICHTLTRDMSETSANLTVTIHPKAEEILTIKTYLHSIFYNLLSNAIKYKMADRAPDIHIEVIRERGKTLITVQDNGMGIDLVAHKKTIFGMYNRFDKTKTGTGLGLFMVKTQVESLGGKILVESIVGKGTTFKIAL